MTTPKFKIEELKEEYDKIKEDLNALKQDTSKNPSDKQSEADSLKQKAEAKKQEIDNEILRVEQATDATAAEKQKVNEIKDTLNTTTTDIDTLYNDITEKTTPDTPAQPATPDTPAQPATPDTPAQPATSDTPTQPTTPDSSTQPATDDKNFFEKAGDWIGDKIRNVGNRIGGEWNSIWDKSKWQTEKSTNFIRAAGFAATGIGAIALLYKGVKKMFGGGKDDDKEEGKAEDKDGTLEKAANRLFDRLSNTEKKS